MSVGSLVEACQALRLREQIPGERPDGVGIFIASGSPIGVVAEWAIARRIDAVIWTALPPRLEDVEGLVPSVDDAIAYLSRLSGDARVHARDYLCQVPEQIDTPYRREIKKKAGVAGVSIDSKAQVAAILEQLFALRESVRELQSTEQRQAISLRGHQTVDEDEAVHLLFEKLQDDIASIEEALAVIAEATGDISKL
ncbi:hypothetical protein [Pseudomonas yamanorum]|uniref:hypothetical protein n=1 Tax=Pseudomonas yamanorum TaxID=515393 RepID=UPI003D36A31B